MLLRTSFGALSRRLLSSSCASQDKLIGSLDVGTQSTRFLIYNYAEKSGSLQLVSGDQQALALHSPQPGWVEQDPKEILSCAEQVIRGAVEKLPAEYRRHRAGSGPAVDAVGITNQRETTVAWDSSSGEPLFAALSWLDARTRPLLTTLKATIGEGDLDHFKPLCGLPMSTYFSALKMRWLLENAPEVKRAARQSTLRFGTVDSWLIYHLTGGAAHVTDVTNASRTMLMNLQSLQWDDTLTRSFGVPAASLPAILPSASPFGTVANGPLKGATIFGVLGDQQAALVGQHCFRPGEAKNTYGTGSFLLANTGSRPVLSSCGLLTTVAFQLEKDAPCYALEGSIAIAGAGIKWLKDNLGLVASPQEAADLAASVEDTNDVYFVPAFGGLFAPYWRPDARGCILGLTQSSTKAHIVRAMLESVAFQTSEILKGIEKDTDIRLNKLRVDGGLVQSNMLMQFQSDILEIPVLRPRDVEATAMGAAVAATIGSGVPFAQYASTAEKNVQVDEFLPKMDEAARHHKLKGWNKAVFRSLDWVEEESESEEE